MKDILKEIIESKKTFYTPIWFMRQAGRYLPEFREIRKKNPNFIKLCLNSDLVNEITLQPINRFDLDAAIIFSDILMIPYALGQKVEFKKGKGPILREININKDLWKCLMEHYIFVQFFRDVKGKISSDFRRSVAISVPHAPCLHGRRVLRIPWICHRRIKRGLGNGSG